MHSTDDASTPSQTPGSAAPSSPDLSVVIPAYNEERRLFATLRKVCAYLDGYPATWELIVVDDGSSDATARLAESIAAERPEVRLIRLPRNRGKGHAVRVGVLASTGNRVLFSDADLASPIEELPRLVHALDAGASAAIGSRAHPEALIEIHQHRIRELLGIAGNRFIRLVATPGISDTQCGFKLFHGDRARTIFGLSRIDGWGFDAEVLYLFRRFGWLVAEVPVRWAHQEGSKLRALDYAKVATELVRARLAHGLSRRVTRMIGQSSRA